MTTPRRILVLGGFGGVHAAPELEKKVRVALERARDLCFGNDFAGVTGEPVRVKVPTP